MEHPVQGFDVSTAQRYAADGHLEEWIHAYLRGGAWANSGLSDGLRLQRRWWNGPLEMPLSSLLRCVGPEPGMEYRVEPGPWAVRTAAMAQGFGNLAAIPPLIAEYRDGVLSVRDGNTRHEALRLRGWPTCWTIVWYNSERDWLRHTCSMVRDGLLAPA